MLKSDVERKLWSSIDLNYVTEESQNEGEDGTVTIHQHPLSESKFTK